MNYCPLLIVFVVSLLFTTNVFAAGPVSRELIGRGEDVGHPIARPNRPADIPENNEGSTSTEAKSLPPVPAAKPGSTTVRVEPGEEPAVPQKSSCFYELIKIVEAEAAISPATDDPACTIDDPVILRRTRSSQPIRFTEGLILDCPFALAVARFSSNTVQALANYHLGSPIETILSGEGFVCRRRNNAKTGKLSEHAFGNATDWIGFRLTDGSSVPIRDTSELSLSQSNFLDSVRTAACGAFTTVLGPGANATHATHFHFDLGRSKGKKNPYRICE